MFLKQSKIGIKQIFLLRSQESIPDPAIMMKRNLKKLFLTQLLQASLQRQMSQIGSKMVVVSLVDLPTIVSQLIVLTARTCDFLDGTE